MIELKSLIELLNPSEFLGEVNDSVNKISKLDNTNNDSSCLYWCNEKNISKIKKIKSGTIIIPENTKINNLNKKVNYLFVLNPRKAFQDTLKTFFTERPKPHFISPNCTLEPGEFNTEFISIGNYSTIESGCKIGNNVRIGNNTTIYKGTIIGNNVIIGSNCNIGGVGFGYEKNENNENILIPHIGNVILNDDVEIGNNTCIDRAVIGSTLIKKNVKIDNLVHIAHGVSIGDNSMIIANSMIAGSSTIEENVWVSPSSSIKNGITIKKNALIGMGAITLNNVNESEIIIGNPGKKLIKK